MIPSVRKRQKTEVEISVVNMVDVVFVLVIFFVLTTTFTKETGIDITKPSAGSSKQLGKEPLLIAVGDNGGIFIEERQVDLAMLQTILRREANQDPDKVVVIHSDRETDMGVIVEILDQCNQVGLKKTSVATDPK
jgi:biopolymer transport protein ExbD